MQQTQEEPLHWDNHRTGLNLTLIFALVVAFLGIIGGILNPLFPIGVGVAIYSWLTNPKQYLIYRDSLVIIYGRPRVKVYPFEEMSNLELLTLPIGDRLRIRMANGRRLMLLTKDTETFRIKLDEALDAYHGGQWSAGQSEQTQPEAQSRPQIENGVHPDPTPETNTGESSTENDDVPY